MSTTMTPSRATEREIKLEAALDRPVANSIQVAAQSGLVLRSMSEAMEFAKLMSLGRESVPKHCREAPGVCLSICVQALEWRISPLALANKSYVVNDRLCWESALYQTIVARRAPIVGRVKMEFSGEAAKRVCRVWAELDDGTGIVEYTSPQFAMINPKNSPLWKNDPDQQLFYYSVRSFARRHFPDVMMGVYTVDEMQDAVETVVSVESRPKSERLAERLTGTSLVQPEPSPADEVVAPEPSPPTSFYAACEDVLREEGLAPNEYEGNPDSPRGTIWTMPNGKSIRLSDAPPSEGTANWIADNLAYDVRTTEYDAVEQTKNILHVNSVPY